MRKRIIYTEHISFRLRTRNLPRMAPLHIVRYPDRLYVDSVTKLSIAVKELRGDSPTTRVKTFVVAFLEGDSILKLITIHPLKKNQELNRIRTKRWLRVTRKD